MLSRSQKALRNSFFEILFEIVTAICGLILPRLIMANFGSTYNGINHSISQFISCIALLKSGIGSVTRAALYKPLADKDYKKISEVINATELFFRRIALVFSGCVFVFAALYPFIVADDFPWLFSFTLVIIISLSTISQYYFGLTYQMLLQADQNYYISSIVNIVATIVNTIISSVLILCGFGIHAVKLGSAIVFILPPIFYMVFVRKKYKIDKKIPANKNLISQRWDAFGHQLANFINNNTDVMVATIILGLKEVSVYSVYFAIGNAVRKAVLALLSGTQAAFGNMIAKKETEVLRRRFNQYELLIFFIGSVLFTTASVLYLPFISIYTRNVYDANYMRPVLAILFSVAEFFACTKLPYEMVVFAAGEFKQTKKGAYIEAGINILISVLLSFFIGLYGILIGTILAGLYRTLRYNSYVSKNIIIRNPINILKNISFFIFVGTISNIIFIFLIKINAANYFQWLIWAVLVFVIVLFISFGFACLFYGRRIFELVIDMLNIIKKHNRK